MAKTHCTCGHLVAYHHQPEPHPCGWGTCLCFALVPIETPPAEPPPSVMTNLFGEEQAFVRPPEVPAP